VNGERPAYDVLLVEDEPVVREAAARILRPEGLTLDRVEDVASALARLRRADHRLVVADLMLPGFSGFDLLDRVAGERPALPVILVTGYATLENALAAFKRGAFDFLPKPFDVPELLGVVRRALAAVELGRWRSVPPPEPAAGASAGERRFLGQLAWVAVEGAVATCGLAESWPGLVAEIRELRLPRPGEHLTQGLACAELASGDESIHRIWAPLGGTVLEVNSRLREDPDLLNRAPFTSGWMVRIAPSDPAHELEALTLRAAAETKVRGGGGEEKRWSF
jgi:CheY-like chemotaxis protein/glycine cleavage system H lipoate-binding protein